MAKARCAGPSSRRIRGGAAGRGRDRPARAGQPFRRRQRGRGDGRPARPAGLLRGHGGTGRAGLWHAAGRGLPPGPQEEGQAGGQSAEPADSLVGAGAGRAWWRSPWSPCRWCCSCWRPGGTGAGHWLWLAGRPTPALAQHGAQAAADSSAWWLAGLAAVGVAAIALALSAWLRQRRQPALGGPGRGSGPGPAVRGRVGRGGGAAQPRRPPHGDHRLLRSDGAQPVRRGIAARRRRHARRGAGPGLRAGSFGRGRDADRPVPPGPVQRARPGRGAPHGGAAGPGRACGPTWGRPPAPGPADERPLGGGPGRGGRPGRGRRRRLRRGRAPRPRGPGHGSRRRGPAGRAPGDRAGRTPAAGAASEGRRQGVTAEDFPAFRQIVADLGWAGASRRHYDHVTRPVFTRLLRAALEDGRLTRQAAEARVGADLWPLIDPSAPLSDNSEAPGVDAATLGRVVDRLERLWPGRDGYDVG